MKGALHDLLSEALVELQKAVLSVVVHQSLRTALPTYAALLIDLFEKLAKWTDGYALLVVTLQCNLTAAVRMKHLLPFRALRTKPSKAIICSRSFTSSFPSCRVAA